MAFKRGWIAIEGLPFHLWNKESFCKIFDFCGGLVQIDGGTDQKLSLQEAKIKVGKVENSFIFAVIGIKDENRTIDIRIRLLSKLFLNFD